MKTWHKLAIGVLVVDYASGYVAHYRNIKLIRKLKANRLEILDQWKRCADMGDYYAQKLNDNNVPVTEFDRIVMHDLID